MIKLGNKNNNKMFEKIKKDMTKSYLHNLTMTASKNDYTYVEQSNNLDSEFMNNNQSA